MSTTKLTTAAELFAMPDDEWQYELIEGVLIRFPLAGGEHGEIESEIARHAGNHAIPQRLGRVYPGDTGFVFARDPDTVLFPDVAFVRTERLPARPDRRGFMPVIPDLAVEVVSPSDTRAEVARKVARYLAAGVPLVWVFWPDSRTVSVHVEGHDAVTLSEDDTLDGGDVLPGFRLPVADVFR